MLATETPQYGLDPAFVGMTNTVKGQISDLAGSGHYYVTPEITRELRHINSGIDHIRLDHDFLNSSREWGQQWNPQRTYREMQGAAQTMHNTAGVINHLKGQLGARTVSGKQDNEVRKQHHDVINELKAAEQDLSPFACQSVDRVKQFCDHIGVTDRYTGYRNNLSRGSRDPVRLGYQWLDKQQPQQQQTAGWCTTRSASGAAVKRVTDPRMTASAQGPVLKRVHPLTSNSMSKEVPQAMQSIQEQCGINTVFPGNTEYMVRYTRPPGERKSVAFTVNPTPNTGAHGRPQMTTHWEPRITEYQRRFEWPDSEKIIKLPWVKKF